MTESINDKPEVYIEFSAAQDEFVILTTRGSRLVTNQKFPSMKSATDWVIQEGYKIYVPVAQVSEAIKALNEEPSVDVGIPEAGISFDVYTPATTAVPWREAVESVTSIDSIKKTQDLLSTAVIVRDVMSHYSSDKDCSASIRTLAQLVLTPIIEDRNYVRRSSVDMDETAAIKATVSDLIELYEKDGYLYF